MSSQHWKLWVRLQTPSLPPPLHSNSVSALLIRISNENKPGFNYSENQTWRNGFDYKGCRLIDSPVPTRREYPRHAQACDHDSAPPSLSLIKRLPHPDLRGAMRRGRSVTKRAVVASAVDGTVEGGALGASREVEGRGA